MSRMDILDDTLELLIKKAFEQLEEEKSKMDHDR